MIYKGYYVKKNPKHNDKKTTYDEIPRTTELGYSIAYFFAQGAVVLFHQSPWLETHFRYSLRESKMCFKPRNSISFIHHICFKLALYEPVCDQGTGHCANLVISLFRPILHPLCDNRVFFFDFFEQTLHGFNI